MTTLEVRCCCDPGRLLGWLTVDGPVYAGRRLQFPLARSTGSPLLADPGAAPPPPVVEILELAIDDLCTGGGRWILAVKSADVPLERLRAVRTFRPAEPMGQDVVPYRVIDPAAPRSTVARYRGTAENR